MRYNPLGHTKVVYYVDSCVHRYGHKIGFHRGYEKVELSAALWSTVDELSEIDPFEKSEIFRVENQGNFECYALEVHPDDSYSKFLLSLDSEKRMIPIMKPSTLLINDYMLHLRRSPEEKKWYSWTGHSI